jgi:pimeloyl-ACP methyl ester carboxylesterase
MVEIGHDMIRAGGRNFHIATAGSGPLVLLLHGFPELWYSWRHQLTGLAGAGFWAVAPDMRGYGRSDIPADPGEYTIHHLVGDVVAMIDALGRDDAVIAGHDWGSQVAWHTALMRPDRVRGVVGMSVPYRPRPGLAPLAVLRRAFGERHYMIYFQQPRVAEADLERDVRSSLQRLFHGTSGRCVRTDVVVPEDEGFLNIYPAADRSPSWLSDVDLAVFTVEFERTGFTGGLNWYRNLDMNWRLTAPLARAKVTVPALYLVGEHDFVIQGSDRDQLAAELRRWVPALRDTVMFPTSGHWTQQECPDEVTTALAEFAASVN